jgi:hypothetical protein
VVTAIHGEDQLAEFTAAIGLPPLSDDDMARIEALAGSGFAPPDVPDGTAASPAPEVTAAV